MKENPWPILAIVLIVFAIILVVVLIAAPANAEIEYEEGATFDGGLCWEADGTEGITTFDGECMTPADYDEIFSYENLSKVASIRPYDEGRSIAEVYGLSPADDPASDRPIGTGLVEPGTERSFKERVAAAHTPHLPTPV